MDNRWILLNAAVHDIFFRCFCYSKFRSRLKLSLEINNKSNNMHINFNFFKGILYCTLWLTSFD